MKRFAIMVFMVLVLILAACQAEGTDNEAGSQEPDAAEAEESSDGGVSATKGTIKQAEFDKVFSDPKAYKGYEVTFTGKVFVQPERDNDGTYLQVFADPENAEQNVIVGVEDPDLDVSSEDYIRVSGVIRDEFTGENAFGAELKALVVGADTVEVVDYVTAVSPAMETIQVDQSQDQHGYVMHVDKVEIADNMTRVYVKITNNTDKEISFYSFNSRLLIGNKQLEEEQVYDSGLPEVQSSILPGMETEGVITFPAVDPSTETMTFHAEGSSENYDLNFKPFTFDIGK
ncbi:DUF4352 domain-containing protein [Lentibacillus cibarius]|uniref:DUF4352 domain-containing protein n=1 Tax=Lentibacillus cibarius TaxID=2583219 RepID=A0A5S3QMR1_9BACI|nr:DUF4352 domain-containing protein [Lentibacillus cibarius]TMN23242.1 DUF4352 domain-containing protein [Lentibacillus cibarius]